jgi:hypothetical protein
MCSIPVDEEEKAFLVMVDYDDQESTYYISSKSAFNLAKEYAKSALLCIGANRYQFKNGEPVLDFVYSRSS